MHKNKRLLDEIFKSELGESPKTDTLTPKDLKEAGNLIRTNNWVKDKDFTTTYSLNNEKWQVIVGPAKEGILCVITNKITGSFGALSPATSLELYKRAVNKQN